MSAKLRMIGRAVDIWMRVIEWSEKVRHGHPGDPQGDDHHPALELKPVEHHHREAQICELA